MLWPWTLGSLAWALAAGIAGAAAGWRCAGFAQYCSRLLARAAHAQAGPALPTEAAVCIALRASASCRPKLPRRRAQPWLAPCAAVLSAGLFFLLAGRHGATLPFAASAMAVMLLLALAVIDARTGLLPDILTISLLWLGLGFAWLAGKTALYEAVSGAMLGYGFLYGLFLGFRALRGRDGMGHGDFKLAAALGAWVGPASLVHVLLIASLLAVLCAVCSVKTRRMSASLPFGPFLAAGGICAIVLFPELHLGF